VKVVLLDIGFEEIADTVDRSERILVARKPLAIKHPPSWLRQDGNPNGKRG
jgi:hypothetical protein